MQPPYLTHKSSTGYRTALEANISGSSLSRADLAKALLDTLSFFEVAPNRVMGREAQQARPPGC
ncbi:hypothetical protein [Streptomyces sp. NPDC059018]|uniref:hypothetical protein n=1 Tax=Streptomyces sp. NPDC059018 TaxID=3346701 RepID=UPI003695E669